MISPARKFISGRAAMLNQFYLKTAVLLTPQKFTSQQSLMSFLSFENSLLLTAYNSQATPRRKTCSNVSPIIIERFSLNS